MLRYSSKSHADFPENRSICFAQSPSYTIALEMGLKRDEFGQRAAAEATLVLWLRLRRLSVCNEMGGMMIDGLS